MAEQPNPYRAPAFEEPHETWWTRIKRRLFSDAIALRLRAEPAFERGDAIICGGIAYFIDPDDSSVFYAGSPSQDHSDEKFALVVSEALRNLTGFLDENTTMRSLIDDRRFVVRIVSNYDGIRSQCHRSTEIPRDIVLAGLADPIPEDQIQDLLPDMNG